MDKALAKHVVTVAYRAQSPLGDIIPLLKQHCLEKEYKIFILAISKAMHTINVELTERIYELYPEIKEEVKENIEKYGFVF